jgi:uncharacterized membrane protein
LSICAIVLAKLFGRLIPPGLSGLVGADAVDRILSIIANSMLAVTTFSLTIMVASRRSVSSLWTPRAHQVMLQDTTTHTVLATFVGAYIYAIIVIVLRQTQVFQGEELLVLFAVTLGVVVLVLFAMVRWILHLELLGSLIETAQRIEDQAQSAYDLRGEQVHLGCSQLHLSNNFDGFYEVKSELDGYFQQIYHETLGRKAQACGAEVYIPLAIGSYVHRGDVVAYISRDEEGLNRAIRECLVIGTLRNYEQDPGFGLTNLTEIGQRALSPGVNDPGTAVDMVRRITRVLHSDFDVSADQGDDPREVRFKHLHLLPLDRAALLHDTLGRIGDLAGDQIEVIGALRQSLIALRSHQNADMGRAAQEVLDQLDRQAKKDLRADQAARLGI